MRLDKYLVSQGLGTRSSVQIDIKNKLVTVNNITITKKDHNVDPFKDNITYNKELIEYHEYFYLVLNKPAGYICATIDNYQPTVLSLINSPLDYLIVGRLDKDTEGLLLLTTDGKFVHQITSPNSKIEKEYYVEYIGTLTDEMISQLETGITIDDYTTSPAQIKKTTQGAFITIHEGKFHQVKKMFNHVGLQVTYLKRVRVGSFVLPIDLKIGSYRLLTEEEIKKCLK